MSKWCGTIGFAVPVEYERGSWENQIIERASYMGDIISNNWKRQTGQGVNDDINLSNQISIVADPYALSHISDIIYITHRDTKWKVTNVDDTQYPRLILTVGGVYNGNTPRASN